MRFSTAGRIPQVTGKTGMSVSIISCPGCKQLILSDTVQCPTCHHVLDEQKADKITTELPAVVKSADDEVSCPDCGEMVRAGLVRCWRCGGFLREEIAETYQKMLDGPQKATYSDVAAEQLNKAEKKEAAPSSSDDDDNDFTLAEGVSMVSEEQLMMKAKAEARAEAQLQAAKDKDEPAGDTYGLAQSESKSDAPTESTAEEASAEKPAEESATESAEAPKSEEKPAEGESAEEKKSDEKSDDESSGLAETGDVLLDIAMKEEKEAATRKKTRAKEKAKGKSERVALPGFLFVYCPNGHQIHVEEKYRGQTGRCPRCKSFFHVPQLDWKAKKEQEKQAEEEANKQSRYHTWTLDAKIHQVDPTKLKLKAGSLQKEFQEVDLGFTDDSLLVVTQGKQNAGMFGGEKNKKKVPELRSEVQEHLRLDKELLDVPAAGFREYAKDKLKEMQVVQPAPYIHESIFAGVPVFGEGLVGVRMPVTEQDKDVKDVLFISFTLSEFREFSEQVKELFDIADFGQAEGVPLEDSTSRHKCHYSDRFIEAIEATDFHHADTKMELEIVGRKCQACGLVVSEESRKKEKLGGAAGKGIAKAKCPKCTQKFGDTTLYGLKQEEGQAEGLDSSGGLNS